MVETWDLTMRKNRKIMDISILTMEKWWKLGIQTWHNGHNGVRTKFRQKKEGTLWYNLQIWWKLRDLSNKIMFGKSIKKGCWTLQPTYHPPESHLLYVKSSPSWQRPKKGLFNHQQHHSESLTHLGGHLWSGSPLFHQQWLEQLN